MWDARYNNDEYVFGKNANDYLRGMYQLMPKGNILVMGSGEGRNAVFLARKNYAVTAVDASQVGTEKALKLAAENKVAIDAVCSDIFDYPMGENQWEGITSIFLHLPEPLRNKLLSRVITALKPGGVFIMEAYTPEQLRYDTGGPRSAAMLADFESVLTAMEQLETLHAGERVRMIDEGVVHVGPGAVMQYTGRKLPPDA